MKINRIFGVFRVTITIRMCDLEPNYPGVHNTAAEFKSKAPELWPEALFSLRSYAFMNPIPGPDGFP